MLIRPVSNELLPAETPCGGLLGVHDYLVSDLTSRASDSLEQRSDEVDLTNLAEVRGSPTRCVPYMPIIPSI